MLRTYGMIHKLMNGIKSIYIYSLACLREKEGYSECFGTDSGVEQGCVMSPLLFNWYMDTMKLKKGKWGLGKLE